MSSRTVSFWIVTLLAPVWATAAELNLSVDVPADLGGVTFGGHQTFRTGGGAYDLVFDGPSQGLPPELSVSGLVVLEDGALLLTTDVAFEAGGNTFRPHDVIRFEAGTFSTFLGGDLLGLAPGARIDALARLTDGALAISFDRAETVGTATYRPADVARIDGTALSIEFDATLAGIPAGVNLVGYDKTSDGRRMLAFDVPVTFGTNTFTPDEIVVFDGVDFAVAHQDPDLPPYARFSALSLPGSPGEVDGLRLAKSGGAIELTWNASCSAASGDYAIYRGPLGAFAGHVPVTCTTGGATIANVAPVAGDRYFLVVPQNGEFEGSYGRDSSGAERPALTGSCRISQHLRECP